MNINKGQTILQFSGKMKVADLIDLDYRLLGVISRLGMKVGFGDLTVSEFCGRHGVDAHTFLVLCKAYTFNEYRPSAEILDAIKAGDVLHYLRLSHDYYAKKALVALETALEKILDSCDKRVRQVIWKFFSDYKAELEKHFEFEEKCVFPYVETLASGEPCRHDMLDDSHNDIEDKIDDLKNIVMKYLPEEGDGTDVTDTISYIYLLRDDLARHTAIEENILMPLIGRMEKRNGR